MKSNIVLNVAGYPTPEAVENSKKRDIHFGGCVIDVFNQPDYHCNDCHYEWEKANPDFGKYADDEE